MIVTVSIGDRFSASANIARKIRWWDARKKSAGRRIEAIALSALFSMMTAPSSSCSARSAHGNGLAMSVKASLQVFKKKDGTQSEMPPGNSDRAVCARHSSIQQRFVGADRRDCGSGQLKLPSPEISKRLRNSRIFSCPTGSINDSHVRRASRSLANPRLPSHFCTKSSNDCSRNSICVQNARINLSQILVHVPLNTHSSLTVEISAKVAGDAPNDRIFFEQRRIALHRTVSPRRAMKCDSAIFCFRAITSRRSRPSSWRTEIIAFSSWTGKGGSLPDSASHHHCADRLIPSAASLIDMPSFKRASLILAAV
jgi:hypothetical protein